MSERAPASPFWSCALLCCCAFLGASACGDDALEADLDLGAPPDTAVTAGEDLSGTDGLALDAAEAPGDGGDAPLALGTATASAATCPAGAPAGATCMHVIVDCTAATGAPPLGAVVVIDEPSVPLKATLFSHNGGPGTTLAPVHAELVAAGYRTVAVAWDSTWEDTPSAGILAAACRPATLIKWTFDVPHAGSRANAFCAEGSSAGSAAISYALSHYGMGAYLDYASLVSGPPFGRIDYGCAPASYTGPPRAVCAGESGALSPAPYSYEMGFAINLVNGGENTTSCGAPNPPAADVARWTADSIVSPGAVYAYPQTPLDFFFCTSATTNEVTGLGSFFYDAITSTKRASCYTSCTGEGVGQDPAGKAALKSTMIASCVPRH